MRLLVPAVLVATIALGVCVPSPAVAHSAFAATPRSRLHALMAHAWQQEMRNNPIGASLDGYHRYDARWGNPSRKQQQREIREMQANLDALGKIDGGRLSPAERLNYRLFGYQLRDNLAGARLHDSDQGLITQLWGPQLLTGTIKQLRFDTLADYRNWLTRMQTFGTYMQAFTQRLQQAIGRGITQPRVVMQRVPAEIEGAISKNPTQSGFYEPFKRMPATIPASEQTRLRAAAKKVIIEVINPAYAKFATFFKADYLPHARTSIGVSSLPGGKTYYTYLVRHFTTTGMPPAQVHRLGLEQVRRIRGEMKAVFKKIGFKGSYRDFLHYLRTNPRFYYKNPQALLEAYRAATKRVDPNLVRIASTWILPRVPYGVRPIPAQHLSRLFGTAHRGWQRSRLCRGESVPPRQPAEIRHPGVDVSRGPPRPPASDSGRDATARSAAVSPLRLLQRVRRRLGAVCRNAVQRTRPVHQPLL